jgi:hypothetical protein
MIAWEWINLLARLGVVLIVVIKLTRFYDAYHFDERVGLGVVGGCALMSTFTLLERNGPFASWPTAMFAVGVLLYFVGRLRRQLHHYRANQRQIEQARMRH